MSMPEQTKVLRTEQWPPVGASLAGVYPSYAYVVSVDGRRMRV